MRCAMTGRPINDPGHLGRWGMDQLGLHYPATPGTGVTEDIPKC